jgi:hypothetical protein
MLIVQWEETQHCPFDMGRVVEGRIEPVVLPPRKVPCSGRIVGYVTDTHGQVCAIVKHGNRLKHVPLVELIVLEDTEDPG